MNSIKSRFDIRRRVSNKIRSLNGIGALKRSLNSPFEKGAKHVIVHTAHHKVGTNWFASVLGNIAREFGIPIVRDDLSALPAERPAIFFQHRVFVKPGSLSSYRGSHMIRDPRDVVLSGYHYHLWTDEEWARTPIKELPGDVERLWPLLPLQEIQDISYQEYLNSLSSEEGILIEMKRCSTTSIKEMAEWNYKDPNIFEFRYEDIMTNEEGVFRQIFNNYGFTKKAADSAIEIASRNSFASKTKRQVGDVQDNAHLSSGKLEQWKDQFSAEHKRCFKKLHGQDLIHLGYENDLDW